MFRGAYCEQFAQAFASRVESAKIGPARISSWKTRQNPLDDRLWKTRDSSRAFHISSKTVGWSIPINPA